MRRFLLLAMIAAVPRSAAADAVIDSAEPTTPPSAGPAADPASTANPAPTAGPTMAPPASLGRRLSPRNDAVMLAFAARGGGAVGTRDFRIKGAVPVVRGDGYGGALLLGYGKTHLDLERGGGELELHRFDASLGGGGGIAPGWSMRGSLGTAYSSDLDRSTWRAWQLTVAAMVQHVVGPSDAWVAGLVYTSTSDLFPVLPIVGYVHQRAGSPFRFDAFLPRHIRAEYELHPRWRTALGVEVQGNTWAAQMGHNAVDLKRAGGAVFGELQLAASQLVRVEARAGISVDRYTLPATEPMASELTEDTSLRAAGFFQLAVLVAP